MDEGKDDLADLEVVFDKLQSTEDQYIQKNVSRPFIVYVMSKLNVDVLKEVIKRLDPTEEEMIINIDATGSIVRQPEGVLKQIYYYAMVIKIKNCKTDDKFIPYPICEMVTASHNIDSISSWLQYCRLFLEKSNLPKNWPVFDRIVTDKSFANLNAICIGLNRCDFSEYLEITYDCIMNQKSMSKISKLHLCCSHLMKNLSG